MSDDDDDGSSLLPSLHTAESDSVLLPVIPLQPIEPLVLEKPKSENWTFSNLQTELLAEAHTLEDLRQKLQAQLQRCQVEEAILSKMLTNSMLPSVADYVAPEQEVQEPGPASPDNGPDEEMAEREAEEAEAEEQPDVSAEAALRGWDVSNDAYADVRPDEDDYEVYDSENDEEEEDEYSQMRGILQREYGRQPSYSQNADYNNFEYIDSD
eukprot:Colp12_sorted_trinity150504_noHs@25637